MIDFQDTTSMSLPRRRKTMSSLDSAHRLPYPQAMSLPSTSSCQPSWEQLAADARHAIASCLDFHFSSPIPRIDRVAAPPTESQIPESVRQFLSEQQTVSLPSTPTNIQHTGRRRRATVDSFDTTVTYTPATHRISKAKKGKRVHACQFPGCPKIFTRAEHRRRHELNHNPKATYICEVEGCGKGFHRSDLLARHIEKHELDAAITKSPPSPQRKQSTVSVTQSEPAISSPRHEQTTINQNQSIDHLPSPPSIPSSTFPEQYEMPVPTTNGLDSQPHMWAGGAADNFYGYSDSVPPYLSPDRSLSPSSDYFPVQPQVVEQPGSVSGASVVGSPLPFNMSFPEWNALETPPLPSPEFDITYQHLQNPYTDWNGINEFSYDGTMPLPPESLVGMTEWK